MIKDYEHLPIGKYLEILALREDENNAPAVVAILAGKTLDEIMATPLTEYRAMADDASFLFFTPATPKVSREYNLGGYRCRVTDVEHLTTAQYIDLKEYAAQDGDRTVESLSCILVPMGEHIKGYGDGYDVLDLQRAIREELPTTEAAALRAFFIGRLGKLMADSLTSSRKTIARLTDRKKAAELEARRKELSTLLRRNGGGYRRSKAWPVLRAALGPRFTA